MRSDRGFVRNVARGFAKCTRRKASGNMEGFGNGYGARVLRFPQWHSYLGSKLCITVALCSHKALCCLSKNIFEFIYK